MLCKRRWPDEAWVPNLQGMTSEALPRNLAATNQAEKMEMVQTHADVAAILPLQPKEGRWPPPSKMERLLS